MSEISAASQEQSTGIEQVNQAVSQMDQVTQQNAALVEEASAAAHSMAEQAQALRDAVAVFRVGDSDPVRVPPGVTAPRTLTRAVALKPATARPVLSTRRLPTQSATGCANPAVEPDWQTF
jgi:methyl-accepting chemotaxis protein